MNNDAIKVEPGDTIETLAARIRADREAEGLPAGTWMYTPEEAAEHMLRAAATAKRLGIAS